MALDRNLEVISLPAGADLSAYQFRQVMINSGGSVAVSTGSVSPTIGVLMNKPAAAGVAAQVAIGGVSRLWSGGSVAAGDLVKSEGAGLAITTTTTGNSVVGRAVSPEATGSAMIFECLITPMVI